MSPRTCTTCPTRLSRYNASDYCAACEARVITHAEYLRTNDPATRSVLRGDDTCKRGHDLLVHGVLKNTGRGRRSRKCRECDRLRIQAHRRGITLDELLRVAA